LENGTTATGRAEAIPEPAAILVFIFGFFSTAVLRKR
jgi:hypothetical protein